MIIDPIEDRLGISTYLLHRKCVVDSNSNSNDNSTTNEEGTISNTMSDGFTAISKARFSDFIVHEGTYIF
jgi:hypothetical protein